MSPDPSPLAGRAATKARVHLRVLVGMRVKANAPPLLAPEVKHPGQLAREEPAVARRHPSQRRQPPRHGVQRTLVETHHLRGEGASRAETTPRMRSASTVLIWPKSRSRGAGPAVWSRL